MNFRQSRRDEHHTKMKTYWEHTMKERSEFTEQQVTEMLNVEMMEKGVLKPVAPILTPIETPDSIGERKQFFGVIGKSKYGSNESLGICFETVEQATAFLALNPLKSDYDYEVGSDYVYAQPIGAMAIETQKLFSFDTVNFAKSALKKNKAARDANEKAQSQYTEAVTKANQVTSKVWEDWHNARSAASELQKIIITFNEYLTLSGTPALALKFLGKIFSENQIDDAREWFPGNIPAASLPEIKSLPAVMSASELAEKLAP